MFDTGKDAFQKLGNTVILLNETPIYVVACEDGPKETVLLKYWQLPTEEAKPETLSIVLDEKYVDFRTLGSRLGYMNMMSPTGDYQAIFVARTPRRQTVQGINSTNLAFSPLLNMITQAEYDADWKKVYKTEQFAEMLKGKYPSRTKAAASVLSGGIVTSMAFSRWFAFRRKQVGPCYLEYKGKEIGWSSDLKKINLSKAYTHLQETLDYYDIPFELTAA